MNKLIASVILLLGVAVCFGAHYLAYVWCKITKKAFVQEGIMLVFKLISLGIVVLGLLALFAN